MVKLTFRTVNVGVSTYNIGNFVNVTNVYGQPDIGEISGETTPYKEIELYTDFGLRNGDLTRQCRCIRDNTFPRGYRIGLVRLELWNLSLVHKVMDDNI